MKDQVPVGQGLPPRDPMPAMRYETHWEGKFLVVERDGEVERWVRNDSGFGRTA